MRVVVGVASLALFARWLRRNVPAAASLSLIVCGAGVIGAAAGLFVANLLIRIDLFLQLGVATTVMITWPGVSGSTWPCF